jgi:hypothetical protein
VRSKLKRFPEIVQAEIDIKRSRAFLQAQTTFDQYVALEHALEDAGGAIQMFHPKYLLPRAHYATLGIRDRDPEKTDALQQKLESISRTRTGSTSAASSSSRTMSPA